MEKENIFEGAKFGEKFVTDEEKLCIDKCMASERYYPMDKPGAITERASIMRASFGDGFEVGYRKAKEE